MQSTSMLPQSVTRCLHSKPSPPGPGSPLLRLRHASRTTVLTRTADKQQGSPAPSAPPSAPAPALVPADGVYAAISSVGAKKASAPALKTFVMGIMAGIYIGFGSLLAFSVLGNMPGLVASNPGLAKLIAASIFPMGLAIITILGAELYTGNTAALPVAIYEGKADMGGLLKNWFFSYAGNLVGSVAMAWLVYQSGVFSTSQVMQNLAVAKTSLPWTTAFARAILANWLVCIAVWMAASASTLPGKLIGLWMPVTAFVTIGLEHSVANMYVIPLGMMLGAPVTTSAFFLNNLLPVTLGNTIAGALCMATTYAYLFGSLGKPKPAPAVPAASTA